ncbi:hypothetical protein K1719_001654 [Acacia pycnantha]|nr:hypothetical protein K1719_001654 [Acacia pycnantha]
MPFMNLAFWMEWSAYVFSSIYVLSYNYTRLGRDQHGETTSKRPLASYNDNDLEMFLTKKALTAYSDAGNSPFT